VYKLSFNKVAGEVDYGNGSIIMAKDSNTLIGSDGQLARKFDNMTVGEDGKLYIQEDPGGTPYIALAHDFLRQRRRSTRMKKAAALLRLPPFWGETTDAATSSPTCRRTATSPANSSRADNSM
jgi:hypothetical protein